MMATYIREFASGARFTVETDSAGIIISATSFGTKALSAELTQVRVTTSVGVGSTFDAGVINISYER